jgi:hypothetical protein
MEDDRETTPKYKNTPKWVERMKDDEGKAHNPDPYDLNNEMGNSAGIVQPSKGD